MVGRKLDRKLSAPCKIASNEFTELTRVDRFLNEPVAAHDETCLAVALRRDGYNRHVVKMLLAPQAQRNLVAVESRDIHVDQNQLGLRALGKPHAFETILRVDHLVTVSSQELSDEQAIAWVVLDVQNTRHSLLITTESR
jgi:tetraacyldisaccharide-1-P 4'-kinase